MDGNAEPPPKIIGPFRCVFGNLTDSRKRQTLQNHSGSDGLCGETNVRVFTVQKPASNGGRAGEAEGDEAERRSCHTHACTTTTTLAFVGCNGTWSSWSTCSLPCGGGVNMRLFTVEQPSTSDGRACDFEDGADEERACNQAAYMTTTKYTVPKTWIQVGNDIDGKAAGDESGNVQVYEWVPPSA